MSHSKKVYILIAISVVTIAIASKYNARQFATQKSPGIIATTTPRTVRVNGSTNYVKPLTPTPSKEATTKVKTTKPAIPPVPQITAESYLVGNLDTGEVYVTKSPDRIVAIASISKLITSLTLEDMFSSGSIQRDAQITITKDMLKPEGEEGHLVAGESYLPSELMYPLILESSNDVAELFATSSGYNNFISSMKEKVKSLGMTKTSFGDASGLSSKNISSANDLFVLAQYLYKNKQDLLQLSRTPNYSLASTTEHAAHIYKNTNPFVGDPHYIGGKTGRTDAAKEAMLSLFNYTVGSSTYPIAVIVLRSEFNSRQFDAALLFEQFLGKVEGAH